MCGSGKYFFCRVFQCEVSIEAQGSSEVVRHFGSAGHWRRDVPDKLHSDMTVYNMLMEPMTLSASQIADNRSRPFEHLGTCSLIQRI